MSFQLFDYDINVVTITFSLEFYVTKYHLLNKIIFTVLFSIKPTNVYVC